MSGLCALFVGSHEWRRLHCGLFPDAAAATQALKPNEIVSGAWRVAEAVSCVGRTKPVEQQPAYYFEVVPETPPNDGADIALGIGLSFEDDRGSIAFRVVFWDEGCIHLLLGCGPCRSTSETQDIDVAPWPATTVGCGIVLSNRTIVFAQDGAFLAEYTLPVGLPNFVRYHPNFWRASLLGCNGIQSCTEERTNDRHFAYDFTSYALRKAAALRRTIRGEAPFPVEIVKLVAMHLSAMVLEDHEDFSAFPLRHVLNPLSRVCLHWSTIFRPLIFEHVSVYSPARLRDLVGLLADYPPDLLPLPHLVQSLTTGDETSLEALLVSAAARPLARVQNLECPPQLHAPPRVALALCALLRPFASVTELMMSDRRFGSVAELLGVLRALPHLTGLSLVDAAFRRRGPVHAGHRARPLPRLRLYECTATPWAPKDDGLVFVLNSVLLLGSTGRQDVEALTSLVEVLLSKDADVEDPEARHEALFSSGPRGTTAAWSLVGAPSAPALEFVINKARVLSIAVEHRPPPPTRPTQRAVRFVFTLLDGFRPTPHPDAPPFVTLLRRLDARRTAGFAFSLRFKGEHSKHTQDVQARLHELMPLTHASGLVSVEDAGGAA